MKVCCLEYGLPSQVVTSNIINLNNMTKTKSVVTKIAVQMNVKLGGEPWGVTIPISNIMVIGMDHYKDSSQKNTSVSAFVASINGKQEDKRNCTRYFSRCAIQPRGEEFINGLQTFMLDALRRYKEVNDAYPDRIFVYRDGASDGDFKSIQSYEITQMKSAFETIDANYQ